LSDAVKRPESKNFKQRNGRDGSCIQQNSSSEAGPFGGASKIAIRGCCTHDYVSGDFPLKRLFSVCFLCAAAILVGCAKEPMMSDAAMSDASMTGNGMMKEGMMQEGDGMKGKGMMEDGKEKMMESEMKKESMMKEGGGDMKEQGGE
jgi:hypothetical protein